MAESLPIVKSLPEQLSVPLWAKNLDSKEKHRRLERVRDRLDPVGQLSEVERIISAWSCAAVGVDSTYPRPDFMKPGHELWEDFRRQMLGLMDATSFETVAAVLDHWNDRESSRFNTISKPKNHQVLRRMMFSRMLPISN